MPYHPYGDIERYLHGGGPDRLRLTKTEATAVGLSLARGLEKLWDMGLIHNDVRMRGPTDPQRHLSQISRLSWPLHAVRWQQSYERSGASSLRARIVMADF
jgi:hypothetical protein